MSEQGHNWDHQLKYYIALGAPPTRTPADGSEAFMRPEVGFNLAWFTSFCEGVDFSQRWHEDPDYRLKCHESMSREIRRRFPGRDIGGVNDDGPPDILTGVHGVAFVVGMFGKKIKYSSDTWPISRDAKITDAEADALEPVDIDNNPFFEQFFRQLDRIEQLTGSIRGYINWQGVLNAAFRLRGEQIFIDLFDCPERAHHIFDCVATTMINGMKKLYERQSKAGFTVEFATISNCVVNMISPAHYIEHIRPFDLKIRSRFKNFGIHNCAWVVDPYMDAYTVVPKLGYIDMGTSSDLARAKKLFPDTRRNVLYSSMDMSGKSPEGIRNDFERIAGEYSPCDVGLLNLGPDVPDEQVIFFMDLCKELSDKYGG
jgi:hypothetical protein